MALIRGAGNRLGLLSRIFELVAGKSVPDNLDVASPIIPVVDVMRAAELASGFGLPIAPGYFILGAQHSPGGAATTRTTVDPRAVIRAYAGVPTSDLEWDPWFLMGTAYDSASSFTHASIALWLPSFPGNITGSQAGFPLFLGDSRATFADVPATGDVALMVGSAATTFPPRVQPVLIPPTATLSYRSVSAAADSINIFALIWAGPRGARPPGFG